VTLPPVGGSPALDAIRSRRVLRIGTTGDYPPFSCLQRDLSYEGADIDMAFDLGARLGVTLELVPTVCARSLDDCLSMTSPWVASPSIRCEP
jgi:cyclohexadienyl dehydratase